MFGTDWEFPIKPDPAGRGVQVAHADAGMVDVLGPRCSPSSPAYRLEAATCSQGRRQRAEHDWAFLRLRHNTGGRRADRRLPALHFQRPGRHRRDDAGGDGKMHPPKERLWPQPGCGPRRSSNGNRIVLDSSSLFDKGGNPLSHRVLTGLGWADEFTPAGRKRPGGPARARPGRGRRPGAGSGVRVRWPVRRPDQSRCHQPAAPCRLGLERSTTPGADTAGLRVACRQFRLLRIPFDLAVVESFLVTPRVKE